MSAVSWLAAVLTIASLTGYHVVQKIMPPQTNTAMVLFFTYCVAAFFSFLLFILSPQRESFAVELSKFGPSAAWPVVLFGLAVFGIEFGYLLSYRSGWKLSTASATMNTVATALLFTIAIFFFHEEFTVKKGVGVVLATIAVLLLK